MSEKYVPDRISKLIDKENKNRERFKGFAIDKQGTHRPEDVLHARIVEGMPLISIVGSVVEVGLLDRDGMSVKTIAQDLKKGKEPDVMLPPHRGSFTFRQRRPMPCISVAGLVNIDSGDVDVELRRSRVFGRRFTHDNERLQSSSAYQAALVASSVISGIRIQGGENPNEIQRIRNANMAVGTFATLFNRTLTEWTIGNDIPQLYRHYPALIQIDDQEIETSLLSPEPKRHAEFDDNYAKSSTPCSDLETWINMVAITSYLDQGESAITTCEVGLIADWMNQRKADKFARRLAA